MSSVCNRCGEPILWRVSRTKGRKYAVNDHGASGPYGQFHSTSCPKKATRDKVVKSLEKALEPVSQSWQAYPEYAHNNAEIETVPPTPINAHDSLAAVIASHVASLMPPQHVQMDETRVRDIVLETLTQHDNRVTISVAVRGSNAPAIDAGRQHKRFPDLLAIVARRHSLWLVGPAGSGKTRGAHEAAKALGLAFGAISVGPQTTQSALFGYMDATGNYVETEFRRRYQNGGVFLFDEIDRGNPGVLTALNQALENGMCAFPDAMIERHPDFVAIAAANTYGNGASREYVGALQLDAATLNRFTMLAWDYDESLEFDIASATYKAAGGTDGNVFQAWLSKVRTARKAAERLKVRVVISPRASIVGADLLASGMSEETVAECVLWKGLDADTIARLSQ